MIGRTTCFEALLGARAGYRDITLRSDNGCYAGAVREGHEGMAPSMACGGED